MAKSSSPGEQGTTVEGGIMTTQCEANVGYKSAPGMQDYSKIVQPADAGGGEFIEGPGQKNAYPVPKFTSGMPK